MPSLYDHPKYYDLIFNTDWKAEFKFLKAIFAQHASGKIGRLFEPACGTGRLIYRFAKAGYSIEGNDLNPHAVDFCNRRLSQHDLPSAAFVGDVTNFTLERQVDAAFNTINSFRHLTTEKMAVAHLQCMAAAIRPGGIYALGFHLTPTDHQPIEEEHWTASEGSLKVDSSMWLVQRNMRARCENFGIALDITTPSRQFRIEDEFKFRTYTAKQAMSLFAKVPEFEVVAIHDFNYEVERPIELSPSVEDAVFVLRVR